MAVLWVKALLSSVGPALKPQAGTQAQPGLPKGLTPPRSNPRKQGGSPPPCPEEAGMLRRRGRLATPRTAPAGGCQSGTGRPQH